jgi:hypothetical protein
VLDTRTNKSTLAANGTTKVYFGSYPGVSAVVLNVTVADTTRAGVITAYPDGTARPNTSNLNYRPGQIVPNEVIVKVGADGYVDFANLSLGSADLVVDLTGYFTAGSGMAFAPVAPTRFLDTRLASGKLAGHSTYDLDIRYVVSDYASDAAQAIAANITVTDPQTNGYVTVYPDDATTRPNTSVVNFGPSQTIPNATTVGVANHDYGGIDLYNGSAGRIDLVVDVFGYYC